MPRRILIALGTTLVLGALATPAWAATRYAEPGGDGPEPCAAADPCDIQRAVEGDPGPPAEVQSGDEVVVLPGDYVFAANSLVPSVAINLHGAVGQPRPRLISPANPVLDIEVPGVLVSDLQIDHSVSSGTALRILAAATAERVIATSSSNIACLPGFGAVIRDSICYSTAAGEAAVRFFYNGVGGPTPPSSTATLINVTAVASVGNSNALDFQTFDVGEQTINATNVIASGSGTAADVQAANMGTSVTINLDHSNYDTENEPGPNTTITDPGSGTNQLSPPLFVDAAAGDFHQAPGSPTIDAGTGTPALGLRQLGAADIDGETRSQGPAPDIGADEFTVPDTDPPETTIIKGPKRKTRKRKAKFTFSSDEPGSTFLCKLDKQSFIGCYAHERFRVKRGKHKLQVTAVDPAGNTDPTPAKRKWKVEKKKTKK